MEDDDERFPVGMRVLVVDDDATCLMYLETMLRKCHYHVTTTTRAREALRMLKENRKRFDIVITDVEMPDMDGLKLLQLVGLEMDLPVIMLSAYSDPKNVMKGIRNGACDFLLKPVRIQELQNIWQHVVRRKESFMLPKPPSAATGGGGGGGGGIAPPLNSTAADQDRRGIEDNTADDNNVDDDHDEELGLEESDQNNEEPSTRKKTRLFWSVELHQKFVDAVNQLGHDKAFPKKILDLMNVEGLTREKVASHLQKYRLYLKKMKGGSSQATNRVGGIRAEEANIRSLGLGGGYGVFRSLSGAASFPRAATSSLSGGTVGRLNTASGLSMSGLASSAMLQRCQYPISLTSLPPASFPANQNATAASFQGGVPPANSTLTLQQQNKASLLCPPPPTPSVLHGNPPPNMRGCFSNQSFLCVSPSNMGASFEEPPASLQNPLQSSLPATSFHHNPFPSLLPCGGISQVTPHDQNVQDDQLDLFCGISDPKGNIQTQDDLTLVDSFNTNLVQPHGSLDHRPDYILNSCNLANDSRSLITSATPFDQTLCQSKNDVVPSSFGELEGITSRFIQQDEVQKANGDSSLRFDENYLLDDTKLLGGSSQNNSEYLEDIVGRFLKQGNGETEAEDNDFDLDPFRIR